PRLAVCGLNPHASDGGIMGDEEERVIAPAVAALRGAVARLGGKGELVGPVAADAAYRDHVLGRHDGVLAMFHDQATIAAKLADPFLGVNYTAGLPFVRTSPDHGTADDVAGTGRADHRSMREAVLLAARIVSCRSGLRRRLDELRAAL
ncbi:MAG: 4-hydroxythreonine-4-phosphate dehydrogenase PdxA, partial [Deltaproteobacteria bacterium]|nr:4-hydroxythreonine-4-phosphate dehydrogenase PdxA [Deltaproteobacteria bacterium]